MTIAQVVVSSVILFFLYRYLLNTIGVAKLGVWSVVMAAASASRMSELGLSGSVVKFVAKYKAHSDMTERKRNGSDRGHFHGCSFEHRVGIAFPRFFLASQVCYPRFRPSRGSGDFTLYAHFSLVYRSCGGIPIGAGGVPAYRSAQLDPDGKQYPLFIADGRPGAGIRAHRSCLRAGVTGRDCSCRQLDTPSE